MTDIVSISMPADGDPAGITQASPNDFTVNGSSCIDPGTGAVATLKTTSLVDVNGGAGGAQTFRIDLLNGFLNGLDFAIDLGGDHLDHFMVLGSGGDDKIIFASSGFVLRPLAAALGGGAVGTVTGTVLLDIIGGAGNDILSLAGRVNTTGDTIGGAYAGTANLLGEAGHDGLYEGTGTNFLSGGTERDFVSYENRADNVTVTADDFADDGDLGESDNVGSDVEVIIGGSGNDRIRPSFATPYHTGFFPEHHCAESDNESIQACAGPGDDTFVGAVPSIPTILSGGLGTDTIDLTGLSAPASISLDDRQNDGWGGEPQTHRMNVKPTVENILGGSHHDILRGSDSANTITGGTGNDTIEGGPGSDTLDGAGGTDTITYAGHPEGVVVTFDGVANDGSPGENDTLLGFEELSGSEFTDHLVGSDTASDSIRGLGGDDAIEGLGGSDRLMGGFGEDALDGGEGEDVLYGSSPAQDVAERDVLNGGGGRDRLFAGSGDDDLLGGAGNDDLDGGPGADLIVGGAGPRDVAHYDERTARVEVTLGGGADDGESGENDDVGDSVEWVYGGEGNDEIVSASRGPGGPAIDNVFSGGGGRDELKGGDGQDILNGGEGNDDLRGGSSADILRGQAGEDERRGQGDSDVFRAVDDERDEIRGGPGSDVAYVDSLDLVRSVATIHQSA